VEEVNGSHPAPTLAAAGKCKNRATATRVIRTRQPPGFKEQNDPVPGSQPDRERRQRLVQRASKPPSGLAARSTRFTTRPRKHPARFSFHSFSIPHARFRAPAAFLCREILGFRRAVYSVPRKARMRRVTDARRQRLRSLPSVRQQQPSLSRVTVSA
jgi:hypothetical protein